MSDESKPSAAASEAAAAPVETTGDASAASGAESKKEAKREVTAPAAGEAPAKEESAKVEDSEKPADDKAEDADVEMKDVTASAAEPADGASEEAQAEPGKAGGATRASKRATSGDAANAGNEKAKPRRKSAGGSASAKKLNKKASKARITHIDAKPGDHFFVKLKGFPQWPAIICDEDMLPQALLTTRPVSAKRPDGTYRDDYADAGKRAGDRSFPVMYLYTNEFGWVLNTDLIELNTETVLDVKMDKMRKDLQAAYQLASENHPVSYYKGVLQEFQEELLAKQKAKEAKASTPAKKKKKAEEEEDTEMADADEDGAEPKEKKSAKKRKAEENIETPQRTDSVKKPKIKLTTNSTPKANGAATAKAGSESKSSKPKSKKSKEPEEKKQEKEASTPKEPELTPEEKHLRKEKEVLFLRHKLQKGLLTREQEPKEEEMDMMSEYISKLESFPDLEVSIIRVTKINKVLKAILKLDTIPREAEFKFKPRSQVLLDQWNKLLADGAADSANGVNGAAPKEKDSSKTNGVKEHSEAAKPAAAEGGAKQDAKSAEPATEEKKEAKVVEASA